MSGGDWSAAPAREPGHVDETALGREARPASAGSAAGPAVGRVHGRPAPEYGEYAPEGWVNPVLDAQRREDERRAQERREEQPTATAKPATAAQQVPRSRFGASPLDFVLTVGLLVTGLFSTVQSLSVSQVASSVRETFEQQYTTFADPAALSTAAVVGAIGSVVVFALVTWWSIRRLRARRRTFWVPLLGGVVATAISVTAFIVVVLQDPRFLQAVMQHSGG
ncbi:hypothetical protein HP467_17255 [Curtobacterium albidum]|uniref:Uncharacterized protein n=1 Tax=Curtobacterium citreum TaxID=2036 RepID=A0A850DY56_9MICO|nr:hypothetical protein [Curtobacterium albidum]